MIAALLRLRFGPEYTELSDTYKHMLRADFFGMLQQEYDCEQAIDDPRAAWDPISLDNAENASREYRRRIGGGNLLSYVKSLEAGTK